MFGWKRLGMDASELSKMTNLTEEEGFKKAVNILGRFAKTNFIAGSVITATGVVAGMIGSKTIEKIKEKKKCKELKDTDK